jgi:hypothetical protein
MAPATLVNVCGVRLPEPDRKAAMSGGLIIGAGQAERVRSPLGGDVTYLVRGGQTGGTFTALEFLVPPGQGPLLHVHTWRSRIRSSPQRTPGPSSQPGRSSGRFLARWPSSSPVDWPTSIM